MHKGLSIISVLLIGVILFTTCKRKNSEAPARIQLDSTLVVPVSQLNVSVYFPVKELENMVNEKLKARIVEAHLAINDKDDSVQLFISRFQPIRLKYNGEQGITYTVPVQVEGYLNSKVIGIRIRNKEPVQARIIITLFSNLYLDDHWNLAPQTELKSIVWVDEPRLNIAGIKFNLKGPIEKMLEGHQDEMVTRLDESAKDVIRIRQSMEKLWMDIQKPIRLNRNVVRVWLKADATDIDGRLSPVSKDTLMIEARLAAQLFTVLDSTEAMTKPGKLPQRQRTSINEPGVDAYVLVTMPFEKINAVVNQVTDTMRFTFGGHSVRIQSTELYGTTDGIAMGIKFKGDINATAYLRGTLGFDAAQKKIVIEDFRFDLDSERHLLHVANWFAHDQVVNRIGPYLSLSVEDLFTRIPELIEKGVAQGKLGKKINVYVDEWELNFHTHLITSNNIQLVLAAKAKAGVELQKGLFDKKKPG